MSQKQKQIFTSTPRKRTYLWDKGQGILKSQQSQTKNLSDSVNPVASRVYRVVLWSSKNTECTSKKTKKTSTIAKKKQKEDKCANSQNPDKKKSLNTGTCDEGQPKTGDDLDHEVENKMPKKSCRKRRDKYKLQVNKEIQKWFSKNFNDDKEKDPQRSDAKALKVCQKNYKRSSRYAGMKNKDKCEDDLFLRSSDQIDEDRNHTNNGRHSNTDEDDSSKNNEANDLFDIWDLSEDKNPDSLNLSKDKKPKTKNKSRSHIKCSESKVNTLQVAKNSKTVSSLPHLDSSQVYEFPESPNAGKSKATPNKSKATPNKSKATPNKSKAKARKSSKKKKELKDELVVNKILNVISETKMEIEAMKAKILKQKTKHK